MAEGFDRGALYILMVLFFGLFSFVLRMAELLHSKSSKSPSCFGNMFIFGMPIAHVLLFDRDALFQGTQKSCFSEEPQGEKKQCASTAYSMCLCYVLYYYAMI